MTDRTAMIRSYTAMMLVALWAFQPLVTAVHSWEHAHRYCPEHQTFEETARGTGQLQSQLANSVPVLAAVRAEPGVDAVLSTHETCPLLTASARGRRRLLSRGGQGVEPDDAGNERDEAGGPA